MSYGGFVVTESWTVEDPVIHCLLTESQCSFRRMLTWRGCRLRPTKRKICWETWRITIGQGCMYARPKWKCSKGGCPRLLGGIRRPTHSVSWLRHPSRIMALISISYSTNPEFFWEFWVILVFLGNLQVLASQQVSPPKQSWENWLLTRKMTSKSKNSSWFGKQT